MTDQPQAEDTIERVQALRPSVPLYRHMIYGSGLTNPLDFLILMHIHFMCEDGKNPTVQDIIDALRTEGIRNANGKGDGLVGRKAVYEAIARLIAAGFLRRSQTNTGEFGKVTYSFYEFPASDPNWTPPATPEITEVVPVPLTGEPVPVGNSVSAGGTASPHRGSAVKGRAVRARGESSVSAGQTASPVKGRGSVPPPHPPGGGGNHHPLPPQRQDAASPRGEGEDLAARWTDEQLAEATEFLKHLPRPFRVGWQIAPKVAPLLLEAITATGWEMDDALARELSRNPDGVKHGVDALVKKRIPNLVMRGGCDDSRRPAVQEPAAVECDRGCDAGWIDTDTGMRPCACLPARTAGQS